MLALLLLAAGAGLLTGRAPLDPEPYVLARLASAVQIDGLSDEPAWEAIDPLPLTTYEPEFGMPPTERTEIRVAYDDHYLYVAGRLYDSEPSGIRSNSMYRDRYAGDDSFAILLDTFNDNENALWFFTNPAGVRFDMAITQDGEGRFRGPPGNAAWDTFWDVATRVTSEGWFAEMRIPFSSLGFQDSGGDVEMGMSTYRFISRKNERQTFPAASPSFRDAFRKPSLMQDVVMKGVFAQKPFYLTPYGIGGLGRSSELNESETAYSVDNRLTREIGLDAKYNVTSNLTLDLTVNTDFAQVEADDQQVNLTRFSLFFPEKRQFFQQRAGLFEFQTGRSDRLFYTRRIGLNEGEPVRILGGARVTGRVGDWDVGFINMQTAEDRSSDITVPSENFGVARLRRQVLNPYSYAGGMLTTRVGADGGYNVAYGLDGVLRPFGNDYVTLQFAQTFEDSLIDNIGSAPLRSALFRAEWERRTTVGWTYSLGVSRLGPDYNPAVGFVRRLNVSEASVRISNGRLMPSASPVRLRRVSLFTSGSIRNEDGEVDSFSLGTFLTWEMKNGTEITLVPRLSLEDLPDPLELPFEASVPQGRYVYPNVELRYRPSEGRLIRSNVQVEGGMFYDGWQVSAGVEPTWNVSPFVELSGEYQANFVGFPDRDEAFSAHIVRLRSQFALNTQVSASAFIQYSNVSALALANIRFRYNFAEGNDLWIVYNEALHTDRYRDVPVAPFSFGRTALVKYTYTFSI